MCKTCVCEYDSMGRPLRDLDLQTPRYRVIGLMVSKGLWRAPLHCQFSGPDTLELAHLVGIVVLKIGAK